MYMLKEKAKKKKKTKKKNSELQKSSKISVKADRLSHFLKAEMCMD